MPEFEIYTHTIYIYVLWKMHLLLQEEELAISKQRKWNFYFLTIGFAFEIKDGTLLKT